MRLHREAFAHGRPDEDDVPGHRRRRMQTDFAGIEIDLFTLADDRPDFHVDDAVFAEGLDWLTGVRVEPDQAVARRDEEDAVVTFAVGPVRESSAGKLPRRIYGTLPFTKRVDPHQLA